MEINVPNNVPSILINAIRRTILRDIPHFAFNPNTIDIRRNTTAWHNDYLKLRISQIPVMGIENNTTTYKHFLSENPSIIDGSVESIQMESIDVMTMSVSIEHTDTDILMRNVTTDDCSFSINGKPIKSPYTNKVLICTLRPRESIEFTAVTDMNVPHVHPRYCSVSNAWFIENDNGKSYTLFLEPRPNISGKEILQRAKAILIERIKLIIQRLRDVDTPTNKKRNQPGEIKIENDKFTLPELITHYLQQHDSVGFAGYKCEHLLGNTTVIYYQASVGIVRIMEDVLKSVETDIKSV